MSPVTRAGSSHISPRIPFAAGGFCGTAGDLAAWNAGFHGAHGGAVLRPETYAAMTRPPTIRGGRRTRYGFGVALNSIAGRPAVSHGGDIDGFTTFTAYLPAHSLSVTVLINTQGPTRPDAVASAVIQSVLGQPRQADPGPAPKSPLLFIGKYGEDVQIDRLGDDATRLRLLRGPLPVAQLRPA